MSLSARGALLHFLHRVLHRTQDHSGRGPRQKPWYFSHRFASTGTTLARLALSALPPDGRSPRARYEYPRPVSLNRYTAKKATFRTRRDQNPPSRRFLAVWRTGLRAAA